MKRQRQRGITLIISLIMLVLLTIMALTSFNIGKSSLQSIDNAQQQGQALNAAQTMLNQVVSSPVFTEAPGNVLDNSNCPAALAAPANSRCVDVYGDGKTVIVVAMAPQPVCLQATAIPNSTLHLDSQTSEDWGCTVQERGQHGIEGLEGGDSLCANSLWELNAEAREPVSSAKALVTQGVAMRVSKDSVDTACPTP
jgi:type II secretory pathway pseudopilin PulG